MLEKRRRVAVAMGYLLTKQDRCRPDPMPAQAARTNVIVPENCAHNSPEHGKRGMLPVALASPNQRPGLSAAAAPLHVYLKGRRVIMPDGHPGEQHPMRPKVQATSHLDVAVGRQDAIEPASRYKCWPPVRGVAAVDVRSAWHVRGVPVVDIPGAEHLEVVDEITELSVEIRAGMPDHPAADTNVMRIGR